MKAPGSSLGAKRVQQFNQICSTPEYRSFGLPKDFKDYPVKNAATWSKKRPRSADSGGQEASKRRRTNPKGGTSALMEKRAREAAAVKKAQMLNERFKRV